ncbi:uncharacterized protein A4U43_C08F29060 [Asparagus officinalis]|uniref:uncharacterized protein LOC109820554 n=1 Tax=Asparagus officinalis TaxID=4686 RepID=UPI00098E6626|nr:uncharacterized protein LOC109820554 [Asparagus officinalis]ONK61359.1 uncharacterized protein A4U43_C08F29060 [Asparagus officinalis]
MICIGASIPSARILHHQQIQDKEHILRSKSSYLRSPATTTVRIPAIEMESTSKASAIASTPLILTSGASGRVTALFSLRSLRSLLLLFNSFLLLLLLPFRRRTIAVSEKSEGVVVRVPAAMVRRTKESEAAARRAMAIKRLKEIEEEMEETKTSSKEFSLMSTVRGDTIFTRSWTPIASKIKGLVVVMHGLNEHSGRYNYFAKQLNASGFKVYAMDWTGHGGSDGLHGYVHSLDYAVNDLKTFLDKVLTENPGLPCFCFGHSTGAAIILKAVLDPKVEARISGVVCTSPAIGVQPSHPIVAVVAPIFSLLLPRYQISNANKKGPPVSRDPEALRAKYSDPLVFTGSLRIRTGYEILRITYHLQQNLNKVTVPFLVLHGTADTVTDPTASQRLYDEASSDDKSIKLYDGFFHDLLFEPERDDILKDIIDWLCCRVE